MLLIEAGKQAQPASQLGLAALMAALIADL